MDTDILQSLIENTNFNCLVEANDYLQTYGILASAVDEDTVNLFSLDDGSYIGTVYTVDELPEEQAEDTSEEALPEPVTEDPAPLASLLNPTPLGDIFRNGRSDEFRAALALALSEGGDDGIDDIDADLLAKLRARAAASPKGDASYVDAASDDRTVNNVMRHEYRVLSDEEKANMVYIKDLGLEFVEFFDSLGTSRELSIAKTKVEEAVMWAIKALTA